MIKLNQDLFNGFYNILMSNQNGEAILDFDGFRFILEFVDFSDEANEFQMKNFGRINELPIIFNTSNEKLFVVVFPKVPLQKLNISFETFMFLLFHEIGHIMNGDKSIEDASVKTEVRADTYSKNLLEFTKEECTKICDEFFNGLLKIVAENIQDILTYQFVVRREMMLKETN